MRKYILILQVLLIATKILSQTVSYPDVDRKTTQDVYIKSVATTNSYTQINFIYKNSESQGRFIFLNLPGHEDAFFIRAKGQVFKLLSTQGIGNYDGITVVMPDREFEFSARFERLPEDVTQFDLIEGKSGPWDFYGVRLIESESMSSSLEKFRVDYNYVTFYDSSSDTWGDWLKGDNTFVINVNDQGDIAHIKPNRETVIYKRLSDVEEGYTTEGNHHFQIIHSLDEDGNFFFFQLFDDTSIGLIMVYESVKVQFANL